MLQSLNLEQLQDEIRLKNDNPDELESTLPPNSQSLSQFLIRRLRTNLKE